MSLVLYVTPREFPEIEKYITIIFLEDILKLKNSLTLYMNTFMYHKCDLRNIIRVCAFWLSS